MMKQLLLIALLLTLTCAIEHHEIRSLDHLEVTVGITLDFTAGWATDKTTALDVAKYLSNNNALPAPANFDFKISNVPVRNQGTFTLEFTGRIHDDAETLDLSAKAPAKPPGGQNFDEQIHVLDLRLLFLEETATYKCDFEFVGKYKKEFYTYQHDIKGETIMDIGKKLCHIIEPKLLKYQLVDSSVFPVTGCGAHDKFKFSGRLVSAFTKGYAYYMSFGFQPRYSLSLTFGDKEYCKALKTLHQAKQVDYAKCKNNKGWPAACGDQDTIGACCEKLRNAVTIAADAAVPCNTIAEFYANYISYQIKGGEPDCHVGKAIKTVGQLEKFTLKIKEPELKGGAFCDKVLAP